MQYFYWDDIPARRMRPRRRQAQGIAKMKAEGKNRAGAPVVVVLASNGR
jgi:hypothetical protein